MTTLGPLVKRLRMARNISQSELARTIGVRPSTVSCIEGGKRGASRYMVELVIDGLRLDTADANTVRRIAGYPIEGMFVAIPILAQIDTMLTDPTLPEPVATAARQQLASLATMVSAVMQKEEG